MEIMINKIKSNKIRIQFLVEVQEAKNLLLKNL
jgi:hypothetical protein